MDPSSSCRAPASMVCNRARGDGGGQRGQCGFEGGRKTAHVRARLRGKRNRYIYGGHPAGDPSGVARRYLPDGDYQQPLCGNPGALFSPVHRAARLLPPSKSDSIPRHSTNNYVAELSATYREALQDQDFLAWRELGAQRKADNIMRVCRGLNPGCVIRSGCGTGIMLRRLHAANFHAALFLHGFVAIGNRLCPRFVPGLCRKRQIGKRKRWHFPMALSIWLFSATSSSSERTTTARAGSLPCGALCCGRGSHREKVNITMRKLCASRIRPSPGPATCSSGARVDCRVPQVKGIGDSRPPPGLAGRRRRLHASYGGGARQALKQSLRACLPAQVYARLFTTHAAFCARSRAAPRKLNSGTEYFLGHRGLRAAESFVADAQKENRRETRE